MKLSIKSSFLSIALLLSLLSRTQAKIITASCGTYACVNAAVQSALDGDTVSVPAGTATWSSKLDLGNKAISLIGVEGGTIITNNVGTVIESWGTGSNPVRISGFRFNSGDIIQPIIAIRGPALKFRVDHCYFNKGDAGVGTNSYQAYGLGPVYGVIDHCTFVNMVAPVYPTDRRDVPPWGVAGWNDYFADPNIAGTDKMPYVEDCTFIWDTNQTVASVQGAIYGAYGGRLCFRHNVVNANLLPAQLGFCVDAHGDSPEYSVLYYELYNNTFNFGTGTMGTTLGNQRGGKRICHDNTYNTGSAAAIWKLSVYWKNDPAVHRVKDSYYWNDTWNGSTNEAAMISIEDGAPGCSSCVDGVCQDQGGAMGATCGGYSAANILLNRDYFLRPPQSGETFYPYTPYIHPHPLTNPVLIDAVSRKTHGGAGAFDVNLPLTGEPGVECRSGGAGGDYALVFNFNNDVVSGTASVTTGTGSISGTPTFAGHTMTVNLTGVTDVQKITVTLSGVTDSDGQVVPNTAVSVNMLIGDVNSSKAVSSTDVSLVNLQVGNTTTSANFRTDVNLSGAISSTDKSIVQAASGHGL
jgi:dockerin type I repeat protein